MNIDGMNIFFDTDCARAWDEWIKHLALEMGAHAENDLGLRGYRCDGLQLIMWKEYPHGFGSIEAYKREAQKSFLAGQLIEADRQRILHAA